MTSTSGNSGELRPTSPFPVVELSVSVSSAELDLQGTRPFSVILHATLRADHPITFPISETLFSRTTALYLGGLEFLDTESNTTAPRDTINVCKIPGNIELSSETEHAFITLYPGKEHVVKLQLGPFKTWMNNVNFVNGRLEVSNGPDIMEWRGTNGFENGRRYMVQVHKDAGISAWCYGTKDEFLKGQRKESISEVLQSSKIPFQLVDTVAFTVRKAQSE